MSGAFDGYHVWLGIPPSEQPPNYYRLLGISVYETDLDVIDHAADRQMAHVRTFQSGKHGTLSQQILNELSAARLCLLSPDKKTEYDAELREKIAQVPRATAVPMTAIPVAAVPVAKAVPMAQPVTPTIPKAVPLQNAPTATAPVSVVKPAVPTKAEVPVKAVAPAKVVVPVKPAVVAKPATAPNKQVPPPQRTQPTVSPAAAKAERGATESPSLVVKNAADVMLEMGSLPMGDGLTRSRRRRRSNNPSWKSAAILGTLAGAVASSFFVIYFVLRNNAGSWSLEQIWQSLTAVPAAPASSDPPYTPPVGKSAPPPTSSPVPGADAPRTE